MPARAQPNPRQLMDLAITAMRQSVHEARKDGKASPMVGAVICKRDATEYQVV